MSNIARLEQQRRQIAAETDFDHRRDRRSAHHRFAEHEDAIKAALQNEHVTRQRVEALEAMMRRPFLGRLRWLFLGR